MSTDFKLLGLVFLVSAPLLIHCFMFDDRVLAQIGERRKKQFLLNNVQNTAEGLAGADIGTALFLTPLIEKGEFQQAQLNATVPPLIEGVESFSGFITVNKTCNSNLFFWMFKAMEGKWETAPLIAWLQGGPGGSSQFGNLREIGPFFVDDKGQLQKREYAWNRKYNTIFIDNPVGTGYSFTDSSCHCTTDEEVARDLYEFILQFYSMFPSLNKNKFYIAGESYAGKYIPSWAHLIHLKNKEKEGGKGFVVPLAGIVLISAWTDPISMLLYGDLVYQLGFLDRSAKAKLQETEDKIRTLIKEGQYFDAWTSWNTEILDFITDTAGLKSYYNYVNDAVKLGGIGPYLTKPELRKALHVGDREFKGPSVVVYTSLKPVIAKSVKPLIEELLNCGAIDVMSLTGQMDIITAFPLVENANYNLEWKQAAEYKTAKRCQYKLGDSVVGYYKNAGSLTEIMLRDCGHLLPEDCPAAASNLIDMLVMNNTGFKCI